MSDLKRKKRLSRAQRRERQRAVHMSVAALTLVCICGIALMAVLNRQPSGKKYTYTTPGDIWYEEEEIPLAGASVEIPSSYSDASGDVQLLAPVQETAAPSPTPEPAATPVPEQQSAGEAAAGGATSARVLPPPTPDPTRAPATITITATGDCTLGTYTTRDGSRSKFKSFVEKYGYDYFFQNVRELFSQDDLTIVNLEGPLCEHSTKRPGRTFNFRGYPEYVNILSGSSIEICNLANNHALDYQKEGFEDTCEALAAAGIGYSGYGPEYYTEVNGYTVGSLGFTEWNFETADILSAVEAAAKKCDLLIVSMHWGKERHYELSSYSRRMGHALIDAGADLVIGNHSHVYGEIEKYNGKYIINSLGNFCFGGNDDPDILDCAIFRQKFILSGDGSVEDGGIDIIPALISSNEEYNDYQPRIADVEDGARMLREIRHYSPTLTEDNVLWLEDSYVLRYGLLTGGAQAEGAQAQQEAGAQPTPQMEIVEDSVR